MSTYNMGYFPPTGPYDSETYVDDAAARLQSSHHKASPQSTATSGSPSAAWVSHASSSADTDVGSDFSASSPPASDDGFGAVDASSQYTRREDWDLLSEMLIDEAVPTVGTQPQRPHSFLGGNPLGAYDVFGAPPPTHHKQPHYHHHPHPHPQPSHQPLAFAPPPFHQHHQHHQHIQHIQHPQQTQHQQNQHLPRPSTSAGHVDLLDALLRQDDALVAARAKSTTNTVGSPQTTDLFPRVIPLPSQPPSSSSDSDGSPTPSPLAKSRKTSLASSATTDKTNKTNKTKKNKKNQQVEHLSVEEAKKLRRRSQIASSVQRHREKKKCLVATLKDDLANLTSHLASLRSQRKELHANNETLVAWEESAMTQRRKRKQSEAQNAQLKTALFQQTCFLMGMRSIMTNIPAPRELHIHDWLHSYTVLSAQREVRQKEYIACFSDSKVDLARQIVLRETDVFSARLTLSQPYVSEIRVLHDGTDVLHHEHDVRLKTELVEEATFVVPGAGQVVKKYTSMFLFEERGHCTLEAFRHVAIEATKAVGVFWPSPGYTAHALETVTLDQNDDATTQLIFSDLHGSMAILDDQLTSDDQDVQLEARMLCRVQHSENDSTIAWDYADKDELYPITGDKAIRRDSCGAVIVRREPGGKISFRSVCVKMFGPLDSHATASNDVKALTQRRISLQASELERQNQKCTRSVYESLAAAFTRPMAAPPSSA